MLLERPGILLVICGAVLLILGLWVLRGRPGPGPSQGAPLEVGALIDKLRHELVALDLRRRQDDRVPTLVFSEATVEVSFVARSSTKGGVGVELEVVTADASRSIGSESVQKMSVKLVPPATRKGSVAPAEVIE